jgi:hypothetical protein
VFARGAVAFRVVGLWQKIRHALIREDEPSLSEDEESGFSTVQYPKADTAGERSGGESVDDQRQGEGFR